MLIYAILFILLSIAVTLRRDITILLPRITLIILLYSSLITTTSLSLKSLDKGIGLYGGIFKFSFQVSFFHICIILILIIFTSLFLLMIVFSWGKFGSIFKKFLSLNNFYKIILFFLFGFLVRWVLASYCAETIWYCIFF
jgi:hypothetical protein